MAALRSLHFVFKVEHAPSGGPGLTLTPEQAADKRIEKRTVRQKEGA